MVELARTCHLREIALDRRNATQLATQIENAGYTVVPFGQRYKSMSGPGKDLEVLLLSKRLHHGANPVLRGMADNVAVKQDPAGNLKPDKAKSSERIDGMVALIVALGRASVEGPGPQVYVWTAKPG